MNDDFPLPQEFKQAELEAIAAMRKDADRYRYLRDRKPMDVLQTVGSAAGCWIDCEVGEVLTLLTGDDADAAIDKAMLAQRAESASGVQPEGCRPRTTS